jgi:hypothetical protein
MTKKRKKRRRKNKEMLNTAFVPSIAQLNDARLSMLSHLVFYMIKYTSYIFFFSQPILPH